MNQLSVILLLAGCVGLSSQQNYLNTTSQGSSDPCNNYQMLSDHERNVDYMLIDNATSQTICDAYRFVEGEWYRFDNNVTGGRLPEYCVSPYSCGTHVPIWMKGSHPNASHPGPKTVTACGNKYLTDQDPSDCCGWSEKIQVKYCPGSYFGTEYSYFVYQLKSPPMCESAYCTTEACQPGFSRDTDGICKDIDECLSYPCWEGECFNTNGSYICLDDGAANMTTPGYYSCEGVQCHRGYCTESYYGGAFCTCYYGYTGQHCETYMPCWEDPCGPGQCNETGDGDYICLCPPGVTGRNCTMVDCDYEPCENGFCSYYDNGTTYCQCDDGYQGVTCERDRYDRTEPTPQTAYPPSTYPTYPTSPSYPGDMCECFNGGSCRYDSGTFFYCHCAYGFTGEKCETALECSSGVGCYNGGSCVFSYYSSSYKCQCPSNTYGPLCEHTGYTTEYPTSPTYPGDMCECFNGGSCRYDSGTFVYCQCAYGFTGEKCETALECSSGVGCYNGGSCVFSYYSYSYECQCPSNTYGHLCEHTGYTTESPWQTTDYWGSTTSMPYSCQDYTCHHGGHCVSHDYYNYFCLCKEGYTGAFCENYMGTSNGTCQYNTCKNGGSCFNLDYGQGYRCICPTDNMGIHCETLPPDHQPCATAYCAYDSTCIPGRWSSDYTCLCGPDYTGPHCDMPLNRDCGCVYGTCRNDYSYAYDDSVDSLSDYYYYWSTTQSPSQLVSCQCLPGYMGDYCETKITSCSDFPCQSGGSCMDDGYGNYYCVCPDQATGEFCEQGVWGDWYDAGTCSRTCGGGYKVRTRYCQSAYGTCEGRGMDHQPCNTQPCMDQPEAETCGVDLEIDIDDAPMVTQNEHLVPQIIAHVVSGYCNYHQEECCQSFGYPANTDYWYENLVDAQNCYMDYVHFGDESFVIQITASTTKDMLSSFCRVPDDEFDDIDSYYGDYSDDAVFHISADILKEAIQENLMTLESATNVDILDVDFSSSRQIDDDDDDDDYYYEAEEYHEGHSKALVIGLSVALVILGLIVFAGVILLVCKLCLKPKTARQAAPPPSQPVATVTRPQMYAQPHTPHDLFLATGSNGMPPSYQQVTMYAPTGQPQAFGGINMQNPVYGNGGAVTQTNPLPPITKQEDAKVSPPGEKDEATNNNPVPPPATVYHFQAPPTQPAGRLPPLSQA